jgi:glycerol-3-phosphate acyltransferase PlsY
MVILILYQHRHNITRLIDGTEPRIKLKSNVIEEIMEPSQTVDIVEHEDAALIDEASLSKADVSAEPTKTRTVKTKKTSVTEEPAKKAKTTKPKTSKVGESDKPVNKTTKKTTDKTKEKPAKTPAKKTAKPKTP